MPNYNYVTLAKFALYCFTENWRKCGRCCSQPSRSCQIFKLNSNAKWRDFWRFESTHFKLWFKMFKKLNICEKLNNAKINWTLMQRSWFNLHHTDPPRFCYFSHISYEVCYSIIFCGPIVLKKPVSSSHCFIFGSRKITNEDHWR